MKKNKDKQGGLIGLNFSTQPCCHKLKLKLHAEFFSEDTDDNYALLTCSKPKLTQFKNPLN